MAVGLQWGTRRPAHIARKRELNGRMKGRKFSGGGERVRPEFD